MGVDPSQINTSTTAGQIALLLIALGAVITALTPLLKGLKGLKSPKARKAHRNHVALTEELGTAKRELDYTRRINRHISDWQLSGRELIRLLRLELVSNGIALTPKMSELIEMMNRIEDESLKEDREEDVTDD